MNWFQSHKLQIMQIAALILALSAAFGLGYLIRGEVKKAPIIIEKR